MIISREKIKKIRELIRNRYNSLIFKLTGKASLLDSEIDDLIREKLIDISDENLSLIKEGYYIGRARNNIDPKQRDNISLKEFNRELRDSAIPLTDTQKYAIEHIEASAGNFLTALRDKARSDIENIITNNNIEYRNKILNETIRPILIEGIEKQKSIEQIASDLREKTGDLFRNFKRVVVTEEANAMNLGELDAIVDRNKGKRSEEIYVYKRVNNDAGTCSHCKRAYLLPNSLIPKVYKLSELSANGTNYGRKASEYKPTITSLHPNCRCALVEIPTGWTFNAKGQMVFKEPGFSEYQNQKNK